MASVKTSRTHFSNIFKYWVCNAGCYTPHDFTWVIFSDMTKLLWKHRRHCTTVFTSSLIDLVARSLTVLASCWYFCTWNTKLGCVSETRLTTNISCFLHVEHSKCESNLQQLSVQEDLDKRHSGHRVRSHVGDSRDKICDMSNRLPGWCCQHAARPTWTAAACQNLLSRMNFK